MSYNMLEGLFKAPTSVDEPAKVPKRATVMRSNQDSVPVVPATKRTWKIKNELWDDFLIAVRLTDLPQAEVVNHLLEEFVRKNADQIEQYKELFSEHKKKK